MSLDFWENKRVFVTGHTGFKGAWLCLWLHKLGAKVTGFALPAPTVPSLFAITNLENDIDSKYGDICNQTQLNEALLSAEPEIVFHLAAQSLVLESYKSPLETYMTNVIGTAHLFEAIRQCESVSSVVNVTTDKCYENREWFWSYRENEAMGGHDPYSSSKGCSELVTTAYQKSFFSTGSKVNLASVRAGNVIGGGDWAENRLVPDIIRAISSGDPVTIRNPNAIRPWQHVLEPLAGYLILAQKLFGKDGRDFVSGWNFGPFEHDAQSVIRIAKTMCDTWGQNATWKLENNTEAVPHEATYLKLDCSKARANLGWRSILRLDQSLEWIVEWYQCFYEQGDAKALTLDQIDRYQGRLIKPD